jgi:fructosamine-3-kinase
MPENRFTTQDAEALLSDWLSQPVSVNHVRALSGGMVNQVLYVEFDHDPGRAVLKPEPANALRKRVRREYDNLRHLRARDFPVPEPYFLHTSDDTLPFNVLALEFWDAASKGHVRLSPHEAERVEREMAEVLLALHTHQRTTYGATEGEGNPNWADEFARRVRARYENIEGKVGAQTFRQIDTILDRFGEIFADPGPPTLVHGDIWATNVMLCQKADGWHLRGFVDPSALYADVEYELAYLEVFNTVGQAFFEAYTAQRPLRDGYSVRRAVYWLNTMIIHVDHFGDMHYRRATASLAEQLTAALA